MRVRVQNAGEKWMEGKREAMAAVAIERGKNGTQRHRCDNKASKGSVRQRQRQAVMSLFSLYFASACIFLLWFSAASLASAALAAVDAAADPTVVPLGKKSASLL